MTHWGPRTRQRGGGPNASVPRKVRGRGTGPRHGAVVFVVAEAYKKKNNAVFLKVPCGVPIGAGLVDGGVEQAP